MSELLNKKYNLELEVLSPLHIGAGSERDWMKGADYVEENGKVYVLNSRKVAQVISPSKYAGYLLNKDDKGLVKSLGDKLVEASDIILDSPNVKSENDIKAFVKNGLSNKPIVPGSSIKGAIRSILLKYFITGKIDKKNRRFESDIFGTANNGDEFMRFIKVGDASFEKTTLVNSKIFNLHGDLKDLEGGWKHLQKSMKGKKATTEKFEQNGFNTIYEVINVGELGELTISLSDKAFSNLGKKNIRVTEETKKREIVNQDISKKLFTVINNHTKEYIKKEIAFFDKYSSDKTDDIIDSLNEILLQIPEDNSSCVLKMSAGSGFHSITGDWQFDDFSIDGVKSGGKGPSRGQLHYKDSSKSRKVAIHGDNFSLMGFVKLTELSEELLAKREAIKQAKIEEKRRKEAELLAEEKAEQERIEAIRKAEQEEKRQKEEKERLEKEAELRKKQELIDRLKREEAEAKKKREQAASKGLEYFCKSKGKTEFKKFKELENITKQYLNNVSISDEDKSFILKISTYLYNNSANFEKKQFDKKYIKVLIKWLGKETDQQWFNEMIKK